MRTVSPPMAKKPRKTRAKSEPEAWCTQDRLALLTAWSALGLTMEQLAGRMGIARKTLYAWQNKHPELKAAIELGASGADNRMEHNLYQNGTDRYITLHTYEYEYDEDGNQITERIVRTEHKFIRADTSAQIFWLCNRRPDRWRDVRSLSKVAECAEGTENGSTGIVILPQIDEPPAEESHAESKERGERNV